MSDMYWNVLGYISLIMAFIRRDTGFFAIGLSCFILAKLHEEKP